MSWHWGVVLVAVRESIQIIRDGVLHLGELGQEVCAHLILLSSCGLTGGIAGCTTPRLSMPLV